MIQQEYFAVAAKPTSQCKKKKKDVFNSGELVQFYMGICQ